MSLKLIGEVALDGSGFERGLNAMAGSVKKFIAGAFGLYGIETMIRKTVDTAKELVVESKRLGIGVEELQVLKQAAKENSTELETLAKAFEKLDVSREKALSGSKEGQKLLGRFAQLGISREDLQTMTAANLFTGPMREKARSSSPEDIYPALRDLMGRGVGPLAAVLKADFEALREKMAKLGTLMSAETVVKLKALEDEFSLLSRIIVSQLGPALVRFAELAYGAAIKFGAGLAGLGATAGAGTAKMGFGEAILAYAKAAGYWLNAMGARALGAPEEQTTAWLKSKMAGAGFDVKAMKAANTEALAPWLKAQGEFEATLAKLAAEAAALNNPIQPNFNPDLAEEKQPKEKAFKDRGDALLAVGNFLGSSRSVLEDIGQRQVQLLQQIADNTRPQSIRLNQGMNDEDFPSIL